MFDRFLLRKSVVPVRTRSARKRLLWSSVTRLEPAAKLSDADLDRACRHVVELPWSEEAREALETILQELVKEGVQPGDRRQVKTLRAIQAAAYLSGAAAVEPQHLEIAAHCLWDDPLEQPNVVARVIAKIANPPGMRANALLMEAETILGDADPRDLVKAAAAAAKLGEIERRLGEIGSESRAVKVRTYVRDQIRKRRLASVAAV